jgi:1-acyl-sn-glycerol-3-phosphate acyltransferase
VNNFNYFRRWLGTALSFLLFGVGGLFQSFVIHPLIWIFVRDKSRRRYASRRVVSGSMSLFIWSMKSLGVLDYNISGQENIQAGKPYLIIANHPSLIDVIFLVSLFPDADCIVKDSIARNPLFYGLIRAAGYISNSDSVVMLYECVQRVSEGNSLIIFPEGTRTGRDQQPRFSDGAAAVAIRTGCECLPVFIDCQPTTLTRQDRWYMVPESKVQFSAAIQQPLEVKSLVDDLSRPRDATSQLASRLQSYFLAGLSGEG